MKSKIKRSAKLGTAVILTCAGVVLAADIGGKKWPDPEKGIKVYAYPEDQVVPTNGTACFTAVVKPANLQEKRPLVFQWQKNGYNLTNGGNISGATTLSLLITNAQIPDVGFYSCVVRLGDPKGPAIVVGGVDRDLPGAQLFVYTGTNTAVSGPFAPGSGTRGCVGSYLGRATMKWPSGSTWIARPTGKTHGQGTETSGLSAPYTSKIQVVDTSLWDTCGVSVVTFPAQGYPKKYQYTIYVTAGSPPLGTPLTLDATWLP